MEIHIGLQCMKTHIEGTIYGDSYRRYKLWRLIERLQFMESNKDSTMSGGSYT